MMSMVLQQLHLELIIQDMEKKGVKTIVLIIILWYFKKWLHRYGVLSEQFKNSDFLITCILYSGICSNGRFAIDSH